jgi:hypothetical protein
MDELKGSEQIFSGGKFCKSWLVEQHVPSAVGVNCQLCRSAR